MPEISCAIITALREEANGILPHLKRVGTIPVAGFKGWRGLLAGREILVLSGAVGADKARQAVAYAAETWNPRLVVRYGAAGAVSPALRVNDLIMPRWLIKLDIAEDFDPAVVERVPGTHIIDTVAVNALLDPAAAYRKIVITERAGEIDFALKSTRLRAWAQDTYGIDSVDWESYSVVKSAQEIGLKACAFLSITDDCGDGALDMFKKNLVRSTRRGGKYVCAFLSKYVV